MSESAVGIMGASLATGNRGVSALAASLVKLLDQAMPRSRPVMLIGMRNAQPFEVSVRTTKKSIHVVNYRLSPSSRPCDHLLWISALALLYRAIPIAAFRRKIAAVSPWINTIVRSVFVGDIRGGDSFSDIYGLCRFILSSIPVMTVLWVGGRLVLFPQTYGPYTHPLSRLLARYIFRRATVILSRDLQSMSTVTQLIGACSKVEFCPDVAFSLDPRAPTTLSIEPAMPVSKDACVVGINVNGLMYNGGYSRQNMFGLKLDYHAFLAKLLSELLKEESVRVLLVPHTFGPHGGIESDPDACRFVRETVPIDLRNRVHMVTHEYDQHELKAVIGTCDFFIGSRMHACIAALSQGIPTVGIAYSKKFRGVFDSVGAADCVIDGRETSTEDAVTAILQRLANRAELRDALAGRTAQVQQQLYRTFSMLAQQVQTGGLDDRPLTDRGATTIVRSLT